MSRFIEWHEDPEAPGLLEAELWDTGEAEDREPYIVANRSAVSPDADRAAVEAELWATEADGTAELGRGRGSQP